MDLVLTISFKVIMVAMFKGGGSTKEKLSKKLLCFGADGMNVFKGRGRGGDKNHKTNKGFMGSFFDGGSLCCPLDKLGHPIFGGFDLNCSY